MNQPDLRTRKNQKVALMVAVGAAIVLLLVGLQPQTTRKQPSSLTADRGVESATRAQLPSFPPLGIQSSGYLPQRVRGLRLGMTISEALQVEPNLTTVYPQKRPDPTAADALLVASPARGFSNTLLFEGGRLIEMQFEVANASPQDASALRKDTIAQLGPPTMQIWDFPEATRLVWIDGDVRIAYEDSAWFGLFGEINGHHSELVVADWPVYKRELLSPSPGGLSKYERHTMFVKWGDEAAQFRSLPRELGGIQLRMMLWQVRALLGSDGLERSFCVGCEAWKKTFTDNRSFEVELWHDQVIQISEHLSAIKASEIPNAEDKFVEEYGTPILVAQLAAADFRWTDGEVQVDCLVSPGTKPEKGSAGALPWRSCSLTDLQLDRAKNKEKLSQREPKYQSVGSPKSFF